MRIEAIQVSEMLCPVLGYFHVLVTYLRRGVALYVLIGRRGERATVQFAYAVPCTIGRVLGSGINLVCQRVDSVFAGRCVTFIITGEVGDIHVLVFGVVANGLVNRAAGVYVGGYPTPPLIFERESVNGVE